MTTSTVPGPCKPALQNSARIVVLIRHSAPKLDPSRPAPQWSLSAEGVSFCEGLASDLERFLPAVMFSSPETKAMQTAECIGLHLGSGFTVRDGLREHRRPSVFLPQSEFQENIRRFFASRDRIVYGSESANDVARRIEAEIRQALTDHPEGNILLVSHGTAMTSFISGHTDFDAYSLWESLDLPCFVAFALPSFDIVDSVGTVLDEAVADC